MIRLRRERSARAAVIVAASLWLLSFFLYADWASATPTLRTPLSESACAERPDASSRKKFQEDAQRLQHAHEFDDAMQKYVAAAILCPSHDLYYQLGAVLYALQRCDEAADYLGKVHARELTHSLFVDYERLMENVRNCHELIQYDFRVTPDGTGELREDLYLPFTVTARDSNQSRKCEGPCRLWLRPQEVKIYAKGIFNRQIPLPREPATILILRPPRWGWKRALGLSLGAGAISFLITGAVLADMHGGPAMGECPSGGRQTACVYNTFAAASVMLSVGAGLSIAAGTTIGVSLQTGNRYSIFVQ